MAEVTFKGGVAALIDKWGQEVWVWVWDGDFPSDPNITLLTPEHGASLDIDMAVELAAILNHWLDTGRIEARNE